MTKQEYMKEINQLLLQCNEEKLFIFIRAFLLKQIDTHSNHGKDMVEHHTL